MDGVVRLLTERVSSAERVVGSMNLSDIRLYVSANNRCIADDVQQRCRARILPALKRPSCRQADTVEQPGAVEHHDMTSSVPDSIYDINIDILNSGIVSCNGCRDKLGSVILFIDSQHAIWCTQDNCNDVIRLLTYCCCSRHSCCNCFRNDEMRTSLVADCRSRAVDEINFLLRFLYTIDTGHPGCVSTIYLLIDDVTQDSLLSPSSSTVKLQVVANEQHLHSFIDQRVLPTTFGGQNKFTHAQWVSYQKKLDVLLRDCYSCINYLMTVSDEMRSVDELPKSVSETRLLLTCHERCVTKVLNDKSIHKFIEDGESILSDLPLIERQSDSSSIFHDCNETVFTLYQQVFNACKKLGNVADQRLLKLERCLQLRQFEDQASSIINWLCTEGEDGLELHSKIADNLRSIEVQQEELNKFHLKAQTHLETSSAILDEGALMTGVCDQTTGLREICRELKTRVDSFTLRLDDTRSMIVNTCQCYQILDKIYARALEVMKFVSSVRLDGSRSDLDNCLLTVSSLLNEYSAEISSSAYDDMEKLLDLVGNERLVDMWRTAQCRCQETVNQLKLCHSNVTAALSCHNEFAAYPLSRSISFPVNNAASFDVHNYLINHCTSSESAMENNETHDSYDSDQSARENCTEPQQDLLGSGLLHSSTPPVTSRTETPLGPSKSSVFKHGRPRWKFLRKALSFIADGEQSKGQTNNEKQLDVRSTSVESLPGLRDSSPNSPNESSEGTACCKYGWSTDNLSSQLIYANKHVPPTQSLSMCDLRTTASHDGLRQTRILSLIMQELIQTERDYTQSLRYVIDNYIPDILLDTVPQPLRGKKNVIFGNMEKIYNFHSQLFMRKIEQCATGPFQLGACFLEHETDLYLYALYNKNKPKSDDLMTECGADYFKSKQRELKDHMDLSSYLLKPVQRMGKYALLLAQITKECPQTNADYSDLKAALEMVRFQLRHGNDLLAMDCLRACDVNLQEQGLLLRQAEFVVFHGRKKCLRHLFLFEELIVFSKTHHSISGHDTYFYKHSIKTSDIGLTESVSDAGDTFELWFRKRTASSTYTLRAPAAHVCSDWVRDVSRLLWKQTLRNRQRRMTELACLGVGDKLSVDLQPSKHNIHDRFVDISVASRVRMRSSPSSHERGNKRPHSLVSLSSSSSSGSYPSMSSSFAGLFHSYAGGLSLVGCSSAVGQSSGYGSVLGTLSTMHESPFELHESNLLLTKGDVDELASSERLAVGSDCSSAELNDTSHLSPAGCHHTVSPLSAKQTDFEKISCRKLTQDASCQTTLKRQSQTHTVEDNWIADETTVTAIET